MSIPIVQIHNVTTLRALKHRILSTCKTTLWETTDGIEAAETVEADLRHQIEDQLIRTLLHSQDVIIPARRVYATLATITQTFSGLA